MIHKISWLWKKNIYIYNFSNQENFLFVWPISLAPFCHIRAQSQCSGVLMEIWFYDNNRWPISSGLKPFLPIRHWGKKWAPSRTRLKIFTQKGSLCVFVPYFTHFMLGLLNIYALFSLRVVFTCSRRAVRVVKCAHRTAQLRGWVMVRPPSFLLETLFPLLSHSLFSIPCPYFPPSWENLNHSKS